MTLLVPVCGTERNGFEHFSRFTKLSWPRYQLIFTVLDPKDSAIPIIQKIASTQNCEVVLNVGGKSEGSNLKVRNLSNAMHRVSHEWMIICDADIIPETDFMDAMMQPFFQPSANIGMVHSLYRCREETSLASAWENVWINCDFWVQGLMGDWLKGTDFAFGAAMALRRETLQEIGGFESIKDYLADDYQLGNRISKLGKKIVFSSHWVDLQEGSNTFVQTWKHLLRWSRSIGVCQPGGYAGSILLNMSFWALLSLCINPYFFLPWSIAILILRMFFGYQCHQWAVGNKSFWNKFWLIPVKDVIQTILWILAFQNGTVEWRGTRYNLAPDGKLVHSR